MIANVLKALTAITHTDNDISVSLEKPSLGINGHGKKVFSFDVKVDFSAYPPIKSIADRYVNLCHQAFPKTDSLHRDRITDGLKAVLNNAIEVTQTHLLHMMKRDYQAEMHAEYGTAVFSPTHIPGMLHKRTLFSVDADSQQALDFMAVFKRAGVEIKCNDGLQLPASLSGTIEPKSIHNHINSEVKTKLDELLARSKHGVTLR